MTDPREISRPAGISVVVPVYNSATTLSRLVNRLEPVLVSTGAPFELILVDDGSHDDSWNVIQDLAASRPWISGMTMMRNFGQHNALLAGVRIARFELTVTMDDDLQHPPEELPKLLAEIEKGFDVVYAPPLKEQHGIARNLASRITKLVLQSSIGAETACKLSAWRAFRTDLRIAFASFHSPFVCMDVLLTWATKKFGFVKLRQEPRFEGKSKYTIRKLIRHALNMMTGFSVLPLQVASFIGFAFTLVGFALLLFVFIRYLITGSVVAGFHFLASIISIFSGAQLFTLGVIGEYIACMHVRTMDKPCYCIRGEVNVTRN